MTDIHMADDTVGILSLPGELLLEVLIEASLDELETLGRVACTCRALHEFINLNEDQTLWRVIHHSQYDNPRLAGAFFVPRSEDEYDWKQRVIDRDWVTRYLTARQVPYKSRRQVRSRVAQRDPTKGADFTMEHVVEVTPRICQTVWDMYIDLPPLGAPSLNEPMLLSILKQDSFAFMCCHTWDEDAQHQAMAMFAPTKAFLFEMEARMEVREPWENFRLFHQGTRQAATCPKDQTDWFGVNADVWFAEAEFEHTVDRRIWPYSRSGNDLEAIRGPGILGLERPLHLSNTECWDWAQVLGDWYYISTHESAVRPHPQVQRVFERHAVMHLFPVANIAAIREAFATHLGLRKQIWVDFAKIVPPSPDASLPPLFFYGYSEKTVDDRPAMFIAGAVQLTNDSPPQIRWEMALHDFRQPGNSTIKLFQGVQLGGRGSKRGVYGAWRFGKVRNKSRPNFQRKTDGMMWFCKIPHDMTTDILSDDDEDEDDEDDD